MTHRTTFVPINDGDQLATGYFNGAHTALTDTSSGHNHDGTNSHAFGWTHYQTNTISSGAASSSFTSLPDHKVWKMIVYLYPDHTGNNTDAIALRINTDTGANQYGSIDKDGTVSTAAYLIIGYNAELDVGTPTYVPCMAEVIIQNLQGVLADHWASVSINSAGYNYSFQGGYWKSNATVTQLDIININSRNFKGLISLYYLAEMG